MLSPARCDSAATTTTTATRARQTDRLILAAVPVAHGIVTCGRRTRHVFDPPSSAPGCAPFLLCSGDVRNLSLVAPEKRLLGKYKFKSIPNMSQEKGKENAEQNTAQEADASTPEKKDKTAKCAECGVAGVDKRCSGCRAVFYCSAAHQKKHWPSHKAQCKKVRQRKSSKQAKPVQKKNTLDIEKLVRAKQCLLVWCSHVRCVAAWSS